MTACTDRHSDIKNSIPKEHGFCFCTWVTIPDLSRTICAAPYLTERLEVEENAKVRKLIKKDIDFLDTIQVEMATARQFFFVARLKGQKEKQVFETANRIESKIAGEGFEVHRLKKSEIKRILALYFEASMQGEAMPDIDGEQFYEVTDDEDEE